MVWLSLLLHCNYLSLLGSIDGLGKGSVRFIVNDIFLELNYEFNKKNNVIKIKIIGG